MSTHTLPLTMSSSVTRMAHFALRSHSQLPMFATHARTQIFAFGELLAFAFGELRFGWFRLVVSVGGIFEVVSVRPADPIRSEALGL